jgi:hypothetical protein
MPLKNPINPSRYSAVSLLEQFLQSDTRPKLSFFDAWAVDFQTGQVNNGALGNSSNGFYTGVGGHFIPIRKF